MSLASIAFSAALLLVQPVRASEEPGLPVTVQVLDEAGKPISTAVVRHREERDRHRVNTFDGTWTASVLYLRDGQELILEKGLELDLEISAPGYVNAAVKYVIRKRKNSVVVTLQSMEEEYDYDPEMQEPVIQFGRDKPVDAGGGGPAQ